MIKWWNSRNLTEMTKNEPKSSEFPLRNMQKCAEICKNLQISRRNRPRTAEMAGGPSPAGTACTSRNIEKSLVFLAFSRVRPPAAAAGRGRALVAGGGRRGWAKMCRNHAKSAEICWNCSKSQNLRDVAPKLIRNWSEFDQNPPNSINFL